MKLIIGITGASGAVYAKTLLNKLSKIQELESCGVVMSDTSKSVWIYELGDKSYEQIPFQVYSKQNFYAPFASGSAGYDAMVIIPCSMGTLGRIAGGVSDDLMTRAADVMLKERRTLILVTREAPLNLIHINNMKTVTEAGAVIYPASPSFYSKPNSLEEAVFTVVDRIIAMLGLPSELKRWGEK